MGTFSRYSLLGLLMLYIVSIFGFSSCVTSKHILYFQDVPDTIASNKPYIIEGVTKFTSPVILPNDILSITILTMVQNETNNPIAPGKGIFDPLSGFLVDKNGNVEISLIGFVKVAGLTTSEANELIKEKAKEFYKNPVVSVRIANFDVYFLGEIGNHGPVSFPSEKVDILEALAHAGDLPITAKRKNVLLIRTEGETKKMIRFDMTSSAIFKSPYFYLRQRDVLYVEPSKYRIQASDNRITRVIGILGSIISVASILIALRSIK